MRYDGCLIRLQFRKQKLFCILPVLFLYLFLLPYQRQVIASGRPMEEILGKIFSINQKYLILFDLWYLFLCFRMILSDEMKELHWCLDSRLRFRWVFYWDFIYIGILVPYLFLISKQLRGLEETMLTVLFQVLCFSFIMYFFLQFSCSSFVSLCVMLAYYVLCQTRFLPDGVSGMRVYELSGEIEGGWYAFQAGLGICSLFAGEIVGRSGFDREKM